MPGKFNRIKNKINFEKNVPRCETCVSFKESRIILTHNSKTVRLNHHCKLHGFAVTKTACCDTWKNTGGETVEPLTEKKAPNVPTACRDQQSPS